MTIFKKIIDKLSKEDIEKISKRRQEEIEGFDEECENWIEEGVKCQEKKAYDKAVEYFRRAEERRYSRSWALLAWMHKDGLGVKKNKGEANRLYGLVKEAAEKGDVIAQRSLGFMYAEGQGVAKDEKEASKLYHKSAEKGYAGAQYCLGVMYANGFMVSKNAVV